MTQTVEKAELSIFVQRALADELLFELRRGKWQPLRPQLLLEPPSFETPGGVSIEPPSYLVAYLEAHPYLGNPHLEAAILRRDYQDALAEIDSLGLADSWGTFFKTRRQLYRIERRASKFTTVETAVVKQNHRTGKPERDAFSCIWKRVVIRHFVGAHCLL